MKWMYSFFMDRPRLGGIVLRGVGIGLVCCFCIGFAYASGKEGINIQPISVFVSIQPQAYFVKRIGGDHVRVEILVRPGASPATYAPTPKQMARLAAARVFFRIGVPFEHSLLVKIRRTMPGLLIVDTSAGLKHRQITGKNELDPHTWMDPMLVKQQGRVILQTLEKIDPRNQDEYEKNYTKFAADLDALDARIRKELKKSIGKTIFVYHPAYGYFCRAYGLHQKAVEAGGREPSSKQLVHLIEQAKKEGVRVIFVQPQFSKKKAQVIAGAIGGTVMVFDPLAYDYINNLDQVAKRLAKAL
ncbi:MAG TPA: ABC transporter substrate-binding protein [Desulfobulbus sp.]|nr:ABC transporter substrate-binding protein [Desulfobulbus sp.]